MFIVCSWPNECLRVCVCMLLHLMLLPTLCNFQTCSNPFSTQNETDFTWWCICGHIHGLQRNDWCLPPFSDNAGQFKQLAYLCSCPSRKTWSQQGQIMSAVALSLRLWQERRRRGGGTDRRHGNHCHWPAYQFQRAGFRSPLAFHGKTLNVYTCRRTPPHCAVTPYLIALISMLSQNGLFHVLKSKISWLLANYSLTSSNYVDFSLAGAY